LLICLLVLIPKNSNAIVNTSELLIIEYGDYLTVSGPIYRSVSIVVKYGGALSIIPHDGTPENIGSVNFISPYIKINGDVLAIGVSKNETGKGGPPPDCDFGGGGAGYGGTGGHGGFSDKNGTQPPANGGSTYDTSFREDIGSYGWNAYNRYGYGGGSIRCDATVLRIGFSAKISADGFTFSTDNVGGGSGGCVYLCGYDIEFTNGFSIQATGGPGGSANGLYLGAGGGGGGRLKIYYTSLDINTSNFNVYGGSSGGDGAAKGSDGPTPVLQTFPTPYPPSMISPAHNSMEVGTSPTFVFIGSDPVNSKFLKYIVEIDYPTAGVNSITANQLTNPIDPGWGGKTHFFSDEVGSYYINNYQLETSTPYFWRVLVTNDEGNTWIPATSYNKFTTSSVVTYPPEIPQLRQPIDDSTNVSKTPEFQVLIADPDGDTLTCTLYVAQDEFMSNPQTFLYTYPGWDQASYIPSGPYAGVTATCQILNEGSFLDALSPGTDYYWRVTVNDSSQQSRSSAVFNFSTVDRPSVPELISPVDASVVDTKNPRLRIRSTSPTSSNLNYKIELSSDNFQAMLVFQSDSSGGWSKEDYTSGEIAELHIPGTYSLLPGTTYTWRAYAYDIDNNNWSAVTDVYSFTVITPPLMPELIAPSDNYAAPNSQITFQFKVESESGNTVTGRLEISDQGFPQITYTFDQLVDQNGWKEPFYQSNSVMAYTVPDYIRFDRGEPYYWRVYTTDGISLGTVSETRQFTLTESLDFQEVKAAPNPAVSTDTLQIYLKLSADSDVTINFYNKIGRQVEQIHLRALGGAQGNTIQYNISKYASGVYYYVIEARSEFGIKKISKQFAVVK
jgi:type IX secretion system substrate protein